MTRTKVLLSISEEDLAKIDAAAEASKMSRSEYLVAMGRHGNASVYDAIAKLQDELAKFQADNAKPRAELERVQRQLEKLRDDVMDFLVDLSGETDLDDDLMLEIIGFIGKIKKT